MRRSDLELTEGDGDFAAPALQQGFGLSGRLEPLPGEHDLNFRISIDDGRHYLFKIHPPALSPGRAALQVAVLRHLELQAPDLPMPRLFLARDGEPLAVIRDHAGRERRARLTTWLDGETWASLRPKAPRSAAALGRLLARLDRCLKSFHHAAAQAPYVWDLAHAAHLLPEAALVADSARREAATAILQRFATEVEPRLRDLPKQVIHGDANDRNILLDAKGGIAGLIDFGDMVETWRVNELAVAAAYVAIGAADPIAAILPLVESYAAENPLEEVAADALFDLILARYAVSMVTAARQHRQHPENDYLLISQEEIWQALCAFTAQNRALAIARLRQACGFEPVAARRAIERWIFANAHRCRPVLSWSERKFEVLATGADRDRPGAFRDRLSVALARVQGAPVGRYGEDRAIYDDGDAAGDRRTLHLAVDLYAAAGTPVLAPLDGRVAMVGNDRSADGFGGVLILEHETDTPHRFWTFYGHLSAASVTAAHVGRAVAAGEEIARLGERDENGNWPAHLHFQLLTALCWDKAEDVIGLAAPSAWELWESVCPDPSAILGLPVNAAAPVARNPETLLKLRRRSIGSALSLAYRAPLKIVRGEGTWLIDHTGRRYLDMVNNVAHVGHEHPRVVAAIAEQTARLNTNTRYLHDNLVEYARRLALHLPPELSTLFLVNSGSEANDLALRLAMAYTRGTEVMVLDHAYHGNLSSLIDISPYKFHGPGGAGRKRHVWVAELPDLYRGRIRHGEADAASRYAERIRVLLRDMGGLERRLAAFFVEPLHGCGGQLVMPEGYLAAAFAAVRGVGGVCIADEVQIGFGRVGSAFWGFETQGVVPDIVTMGKPIGNGYPMGAVACRPEIAAAFANGMEYFNTFGGNPVSAAAGLAVLDVMRDARLMHNAEVVGMRLRDGLTALAAKHALIGSVRGLGLFLGVELVRDRETLEPAASEASAIIEAMKDEDVLLSTEGPLHNVLKIKPPLVISEAECDLFLEKLETILTRHARP